MIFGIIFGAILVRVQRTARILKLPHQALPGENTVHRSIAGDSYVHIEAYRHRNTVGLLLADTTSERGARCGSQWGRGDLHRFAGPLAVESDR